MYNRLKPPNNELYHYGVLGMKWGVRRAKSQFRKAERIKSETSDLAKAAPYYRGAVNTKLNMHRKATSKLEKLNTRYERRQARADRQYDKAERKAASILTSKRSADRAFRKASKWQYKANRVALKGKRWYEQMEKHYKNAGIEMTKRNQQIGENFVNQVRANSRAMYAASYASGR